MKKIVAIFLSIIFVLSSSFPVTAAETQEIEKKYNISVESSRIGTQTLTVLKYNNTILMDLDDVMRMTGSSRSDNEELIDITHGTRTIHLDKSSGKLSEETISKTIDISIREDNGLIYVPAYSLLTYLGASCTVQDSVLHVEMPIYTLWEALDLNGKSYNLITTELWGNKTEQMISTACDVVIEMIYGIGISVSADKIIEEVLYDILTVDELKYTSCQEEYKNLSNGSVPSSNSDEFAKLAEIYQNSNLSNLENQASDLLDAILDPSKYTDFITSPSKEAFIKLLKDPEFKKFLNGAGKFMNAGILVQDIFTLFITRNNYNQNVLSSFSCFQRELEKYCPHSCALPVLKKINRTIESRLKHLYQTAAEKTSDFIIKKMQGTLIENSSSLAQNIHMAFNIGKFVTYYTGDNAAFVEAQRSNLRAMYLANFQTPTISNLLANKAREIHADAYQDITLLEDYRQLFSLWVRTTIATNEKILNVVQGPTGNHSLIETFKQRTEELSVILFRLSNCQVKEIIWPEETDIFNTVAMTEWAPVVTVEQEITESLYTTRTTVSGKAENGNVIWTYHSKEATLTELEIISPLYENDGKIYLTVGGELLCLNKADGTLLWSVSDVGAGNCIIFDTNHNVYITGYYSPKMQIISNQGVVLASPDLGDDAFWPYEMKFISENILRIYFAGPEDFSITPTIETGYDKEKNSWFKDFNIIDRTFCPIQSSDNNDNWRETYIDLLKRLSETSVRGLIKYQLYDITSDGIPELFLLTRTCMADQGYDVYSYSNGTTPKIGFLSAGGACVLCLDEINPDSILLRNSKQGLYDVGRYTYTNGTFAEELVEEGSYILDDAVPFPYEDKELPCADPDDYSLIYQFKTKTQGPINTDWQQTYADFLEPFSSESEPPAWHYTLHDITSDGIPELFIFTGAWEGEWQYDVYTQADGEVTEAGVLECGRAELCTDAADPSRLLINFWGADEYYLEELTYRKGTFSEKFIAQEEDYDGFSDTYPSLKTANIDDNTLIFQWASPT